MSRAAPAGDPTRARAPRTRRAPDPHARLVERVSMIARIGIVRVGAPEHDPQLGALVEVELMPGGELLLCRLLAPARVPSAGAEVLVIVVGGDLEGGGVIVGALARGEG
jgi:hypothetical protein